MGEMFLDDGDVRLYQGDVTDVLAEMPSGSVDCVVTSPPYWGLRDYGDEGQLGLEPTPDLYVERIVAVFRQISRVLAAHGTCWVNLGDSYNAHPGGGGDRGGRALNAAQGTGEQPQYVKGHGFSRVKSLKPKDLVGIPWRVAFALQADGWWLRADIIWAKPNPMPESVTDRPTKAHEYVFLLTKQPRYYFDQEAVREEGEGYGRGTDPHGKMYARVGVDAEHVTGGKGHTFQGGRNVRSVWQIATQPYPEAHFATYPEELVRRCVLAGCPERVCRVCGKPSERIVETEYKRHENWFGAKQDARHSRGSAGTSYNEPIGHETVGWSECGCLLWEGVEGVPSEASEVSHADASNPVAPGAAPSQSKWRPGTVLDPFIGSGTTCKVARDHGRHSIGIDLSVDYLSLAARRLQQLSLLT